MGVNLMSFFTKKEQIVILLLVIVILCVMGYSFLTSEDITILSKDAKGNVEIGLKTTSENYESDTDKKKDDDVIEDMEDQIINVHICGQVHKPGVVKLPKSSILQDGIELAGGHIEGSADLERINLAKRLTDEAWIYIPEIGEELEDSQIYVFPDNSDENGGFSDNGKININKASREILTKLPGIGEVIADRIIDYRTKDQFSNIDEIKNVKGIGIKKYESIKDLITIE